MYNILLVSETNIAYLQLSTFISKHVRFTHPLGRGRGVCVCVCVCVCWGGVGVGVGVGVFVWGGGGIPEKVWYTYIHTYVIYVGDHPIPSLGFTAFCN